MSSAAWTNTAPIIRCYLKKKQHMRLCAKCSLRIQCPSQLISTPTAPHSAVKCGL